MDAIGGLITLGFGASIEEFVLTGLEPGQAAPVETGHGELDPRLWWELYYRQRGARQPVPVRVETPVEIPPFEGAIQLVGVEAVAELGDVGVTGEARALRAFASRAYLGQVQIIVNPVRAAVTGVAARGQVGWLDVAIDPLALGRRDDAWILEQEHITS